MRLIFTRYHDILTDENRYQRFLADDLPKPADYDGFSVELLRQENHSHNRLPSQRDKKAQISYRYEFPPLENVII